MGVADFPPYNIYNEDGTFSGFAVEAIRDVANRANLELDFQAISNAEFSAGPSPDTYDILPQAGINADWQSRMDFALPLKISAFAIFTRSGDANGLSDLDSLGARKVGVVKDNLGRRFAEAHGGLNVEVYDTLPAMVQALISGDVDAVLYPSNTMNIDIANQGVGDEIEEVVPPFRIVERAPALRPGLGLVRAKLNAVIPGYLISNDYAALRQKYFGEPVFWTTTRIYLALGLVGALTLALAGYLLWQRQRQRQRQQEYDLQQRELALEQAHSAELGKLLSQLEAINSDLEHKNQELDEFAYIASHDLKEPLRGITLNSTFLLREGLTGKAAERAKRMADLAGRMEQLISDLLQLSRLGHDEQKPKTIVPADVIDDIRVDLREWLAERNGVIEQASAIPVLHADPVQFKTALQNLIVNGIKFNRSDEKRVEIGFTASVDVNGEVFENALFVADNGIGIDEAFRDKVFRIFSRVGAQDEFDQSGTGSGLAFVRKIVQTYGGKIDFVSSPQNGTTFYLTFPRVATPSDQGYAE